MLAVILNFFKGMFVDMGMQLMERAAEPEIKETESAFEEPFTEPDVNDLLSDFDGMFHETDFGAAESFAHT